jgi:anti-sigma regulatory factor (Ser/Thr protein kinase)
VESASDQLVASGTSSPARARRFVGEFLERYGIRRTRDDAMLLTSELVTNAISHAQTDAILTIDLTHEHLRVSVTDHGPGWPGHAAGGDPTEGLGLHFVEQLATKWGAYRMGESKTVWFELPAV